jgi:hypothetical protein
MWTGGKKHVVRMELDRERLGIVYNNATYHGGFRDRVKWKMVVGAAVSSWMHDCMTGSMTSYSGYGKDYDTRESVLSF